MPLMLMSLIVGSRSFLASSVCISGSQKQASRTHRSHSSSSPLQTASQVRSSPHSYKETSSPITTFSKDSLRHLRTVGTICAAQILPLRISCSPSHLRLGRLDRALHKASTQRYGLTLTVYMTEMHINGPLPRSWRLKVILKQLCEVFDVSQIRPNGGLGNP